MRRALRPGGQLPDWWRMLRRFGPHVRGQPALIAGSVLALVAEIGLRLLEPWPLKIVFDHVLATAPGAGVRLGQRAAIPGLAALEPTTVLALAALGVLVTTGLRAMAAYANTVGLSLLGSRVMTAVRADVYRHLQRLSLSFHTRARGGDLTVRVSSDVNVLKDVLVTAVLPLLVNALTLAGMVGLMFWLHWQLTLLALAPAPLFWLGTARLSRRIREAARTQRRWEGATAATTAESIGAIKVVQALSLEGTFARDFGQHNTRSLREDVRASRLTASLERMVDGLIAIATALVLWYGARLALRQALTPGELLVFLTYLKSAFKPVRDFAKYTGRLARAAAAGERLLDLLEQAPDVRDLPGARPAPAFRGAVRFEGVHFGYEPGQGVLEEVDFEVRPGQHVAVVAPSGNGKSTLVSLIPRLYDPAAGRVLIDGRDVRSYTLDSLRRQISMVLQDSLLFTGSIAENIRYGRLDASPADIIEAAQAANAHDFIVGLPAGYDTQVGERGVTLSNGQRQRIAIARAAIRRAPILILDEATTGLDEANERAVLAALERLARGRTTFLITHDLTLAAAADEVLYLEHGRVCERGPHAALMRAGGRYAALYRLQTTTPFHRRGESGGPPDDRAIQEAPYALEA